MTDIAPLSFEQEEMLERMQMFPSCARRYDIIRLFELHGPLDVSAFAAAVDDVARRDAILRTTIVNGRGPLGQRVADDGHGALIAETCARPIDEVAQAMLAARYGPAEVIEGRPLFRPRLLSSAPDRHLLAVAIHHLLVDGISLRLLWRDLSEMYAARLEQRPAQLPPIPSGYAEYARRQRAGWPSQRKRADAFWRRIIDGAPARIAWPAAGGDAAEFETATHRFALTSAAAEAARRHARAVGVTPFVVLLAATGVAVARVSRSRDVLLGTDFSNRDARFKQDLVGLLTNTRLTRIAHGEGVRFADLLQTLSETWFAAEAYSDVHLDQILRPLGVPWLFSVHLDAADADAGPVLSHTVVKSIPVPRTDPHWRDAFVMWRLATDSYSAEIVYRPARVAPRTVAAIADEIGGVFDQRPSDVSRRSIQ